MKKDNHIKRISVKVIPRSKLERVEQIDDSVFVVRTRAIPEKGKANREVVRLLEEHFGVPKLNVTIVVGTTSKHKIIDILL